MYMKKVYKKLKRLSYLLKAALMPSLRPPGPVAPKPPKMPSMAPKSKKNPIKVAEQIKDKNTKKNAMINAVGQVKANTNSMAFSMNKSEGESYKYHIIKDNNRITTEPISMEDINVKHGGVEKLEQSGHRVVPVKQEQLVFDRSTGQWKIK
jgi:hypothetical protein